MPIKKEVHSIANAWESFRKRFIPPTADERGIEQYRLAFYSGAWAFGVVLMITGEGQIDEEEGARMTAEMTMELVDFYHELETDPR